MDLIQKASKLGYKHYMEFTIDELDKLQLNNSNKQIEYYFIQKWLREKHNIHINIRYEEYFYRSQHKYFHFDINNGSITDVTNQQKLHEDILDMCSQDVVGNYLNDAKYSTMIFERNFAFKTYEEALEDALQKALKLI